MKAFKERRRRGGRLSSGSTRGGNGGGSGGALLAPKETARLVGILRGCVEAKTRGRRTPRRTLEDAFRVYDVDKSETISADEFVKGCAPFLQGIPERTVRALFRSAFDVDGDGAVGLDDFIGALLEEKPLRSKSNGSEGLNGRAAQPPVSPSRKRTNFRAHIDQGTAARPSRSSQERRRKLNDAKTQAALEERRKAPYFNGDRPELGPNGAKIGAKTGGAANNKRRPTSSQQRKKAAHAERSIAQLRERIVERGGTTSIQSLSRVMKIMDDSGDRKLSREELKYGLADFGMPLSAAELVSVV